MSFASSLEVVSEEPELVRYPTIRRELMARIASLANYELFTAECLHDGSVFSNFVYFLYDSALGDSPREAIGDILLDEEESSALGDIVTSVAQSFQNLATVDIHNPTSIEKVLSSQPMKHAAQKASHLLAIMQEPFAWYAFEG